MTMTLDGTNGVTFNDTSLQGAAASPYVLKNRIINGAMVIDQRNAGASVTINGAAPYVLDRYFAQDDTDGTFTVQQSSVAPSGFVNSMLVTVTAADTSLGATQLARITQRIEGYNISDLGFGTASASTITISFWVRSSVTGTFGGSLANGAGNRSYPFSYTISTANTFEYKTITIAGDTSGTWLTTNGIGLELNITLAAGSTYTGTAGSWSGSLFFNATGSTNLLATNGATFYITGVQLEQNTSATPFERRLYGQELNSCQRYYNKWSGANFPYGGLATCSATGGATPSTRRASWANPVEFRSQPTMGFGGTIQLYTAALSNLGFTGFNGTTSNKNIINFDINSSSSGTTGQALMLIIDSASAANYIDASAEL